MKDKEIIALREIAGKLEKSIAQEIAQECYNECLVVECGEGECGAAIATKFPDLVLRYKENDK